MSPHVDLRESFRIAHSWAGSSTPVTIMGPSTSALAESRWLTKTGLPIGTTSNRGSRFTAHPRSGTVIAWCLNVEEVLELERRADLDGLVVVYAHAAHAPWITAHNAEFLSGEPVPPIPDAPSIVAAAVDLITNIAVLNQGLIDSRERSGAVQVLTHLRAHGHRLNHDQVVVEAIRQGWPGASPLELADITKKVNAGKQLRFSRRINSDALAELVATHPQEPLTPSPRRWDL